MTDSTQFLYALLGGIVPSILWLIFWLREDHLHPEPRKLIFGAFLLGMGAVILAIPLQKFVTLFTSSTTEQYILWASIEEILKFAAAYFIAFHSKAFDEPIDAMMYLITVALGFAALENSLFLMGQFQDGNILHTVSYGNMRFIGATMLHVVASACTGLMFGLTFYLPKIVRFLAGLVGLAGGIALHSFFNIALQNITLQLTKIQLGHAILHNALHLDTIDTSFTDTLKVFAWVWGATILLLVFFEEVKSVHPRKQLIKN